MKLPETFMLCLPGDDHPVKCRYEYDPGEEQWFDARAGVGSPGYPAYAYVTECFISGEWWDVDRLTQEARDFLDEQLAYELQKAEEDWHDNEPAEREYE